jgi:hypothetical protein
MANKRKFLKLIAQATKKGQTEFDLSAIMLKRAPASPK